jgi:hypothetical protein
MSKLNIRVGDVEEAMHQHTKSTWDWQHMSGKRLHAIEQAQQQQLEEQRLTIGGWDIPLSSSEPEASLGRTPIVR